MSSNRSGASVLISERIPADSIWKTPVVSAFWSMAYVVGVVQRDVVDVQLDVARPQMADRVVDHGERPQPQEVHLQQARAPRRRSCRTASRPASNRRASPSRASAAGSSRAARRRSRHPPRAPSPRGADPRAPAPCRRSPSPRAPSRRPRGTPAIPSARPRSGSPGPSRWADTSCRGGRPTTAGNPSTRAASRMPCFPLIVWNVMICATWSEPYRSVA